MICIPKYDFSKTFLFSKDFLISQIYYYDTVYVFGAKYYKVWEKDKEVFSDYLFSEKDFYHYFFDHKWIRKIKIKNILED
jgi:hypothetical protein